MSPGIPPLSSSATASRSGRCSWYGGHPARWRRAEMATVFLLRHGLTKLTGPVLAGRTPGVHLDERGQAQAATAAERLAVLPLSAVVTSPLERCSETATVVLAGQRAAGRKPV